MEENERNRPNFGGSFCFLLNMNVFLLFGVQMPAITLSVRVLLLFAPLQPRIFAILTNRTRSNYI